jgi:hypothetical protein
MRTIRPALKAHGASSLTGQHLTTALWALIWVFLLGSLLGFRIGFLLPTLLKSRQGRKVYIYDKRLRHALHQLTLKVYHLDLYNDADNRKIQKKMFKLAKRIWD